MRLSTATIAVTLIPSGIGVGEDEAVIGPPVRLRAALILIVVSLGFLAPSAFLPSAFTMSLLVRLGNEA